MESQASKPDFRNNPENSPMEECTEKTVMSPTYMGENSKF